jgi:hypothetical protein
MYERVLPSAFAVPLPHTERTQHRQTGPDDERSEGEAEWLDR